jgi:hypothetical protein
MEDEKAPPADDISHDELQDLADVALASSVPESMFLTGVLEDAGIPAVTRDSGVMGLGTVVTTIRVLVPRAMLQQAREEIDKARAQAEQRRVEDAYQEQTIAESSADAQGSTFSILDKGLHPRTSVINDLAQLRDMALTESELKERLEPMAQEWLHDGAQSADIAKYLAAAGMNIQQSEQFLEELKTKYAQSISQSREGHRILGMALVAFALLITVASMVTIIPLAGWVIVGSLTIGLALIFTSSSELPTIKANPAPDDKPEQ